MRCHRNGRFGYRGGSGTRLQRPCAETPDIIERNQIVRSLSREILVSADTILVRVAIALPKR
jgi:hypothetical protein